MKNAARAVCPAGPALGCGLALWTAAAPAAAAPVGGAPPVPAGSDAPAVVSVLPMSYRDTVDGTHDCSLSQQEFATATAVLTRWADRRRGLADVPGLVLGIACGPDCGWTAGFGLADPEQGLAATDTTLFRIASITKVFTAMAVLALRDEGRLALDDPVVDHLPWFRPANADEGPPMRIRHLLTHTSGLPANAAATDFNRMTQPTAGELRAGLPEQRLVFPPGTEFKYSNLGYAVLGQVVEAASGQGYRRHLRRNLLVPLGLRRTVAHPPPDVPQAVGHHLSVPGRPRRPADFLHLAAFTPAGGMATTARDMVRFLSFLLAPERAPDVLAPATLREMQRVHHPVDPGGGLGLAWAVERDGGTHRIYHGGGLPTQASHLRLDLAMGLGVVVLTNAEDGEPEVYARETLALLELAASVGEGVEERAGAGSNGRRYVGRYRFQERELWAVRLGGRLGLIDPTARRPSASVTWLAPAGRHRFRIEGGRVSGETAEFAVDEETGEVIRLHLPSLSYRRVGDVR